jgi:hypothetical protein
MISIIENMENPTEKERDSGITLVRNGYLDLYVGLLCRVDI